MGTKYNTFINRLKEVRKEHDAAELMDSVGLSTDHYKIYQESVQKVKEYYSNYQVK